MLIAEIGNIVCLDTLRNDLKPQQRGKLYGNILRAGGIPVDTRGGFLGVFSRHVAQLAVVAYNRDCHMDAPPGYPAEII